MYLKNNVLGSVWWLHRVLKSACAHPAAHGSVCVCVFFLYAQGAKSLLEQCLPDDADVVVNQGCVLYKEQQFEEARQKFVEAIQVAFFILFFIIIWGSSLQCSLFGFRG